MSLADKYRVPIDVLNQGFEYFLEVDVAVNDVLGGLAGRLSPAGDSLPYSTM